MPGGALAGRGAREGTAEVLDDDASEAADGLGLSVEDAEPVGEVDGTTLGVGISFAFALAL